jgi:recombination protein RecR
MRLAYSVVDMSVEDATAFADAIRVAKERIHLCPVCQNLTDRELCPVCRDDSRDRSVVCVVADAKAVLAMEKVREYRGVYHVLHGLISPMNGVTPDNIKIRELLTRVGEGEVEELIIATNPTIEGEATAMYISRLMKPLGVKVTRLAYGIPVGADLEYADEVTLCRALEGRRSVED